MKKQRVSPVVNFQINPDFGGGALPKPDEVNRTVAELTGKINTTETIVEAEPVAMVAAEKPAKAPKSDPKKAKITVNRITKVEKPAKVVVKSDTPQYGRPLKEIAIGREKFTTMLQPDLVKSLKRQAIDEGVTVADLLETILSDFYSK